MKVYKRQKPTGGSITLHYSPECERLTKSSRVAGPFNRSDFPEDTNVCKACTGDMQRHKGGSGGPHSLLSELTPEEVGL